MLELQVANKILQILHLNGLKIVYKIFFKNSDAGKKEMTHISSNKLMNRGFRF